MEENTQKDYELAFLVKNEASASSILMLLKKYGAEVIFEGPLQKIQTAYKIKNMLDMFFGYFRFSISPEIILKIEKDLRFKEDVVRYLLITQSLTKKESVSAVQSKPETQTFQVTQGPREETTYQPKPTTPISNADLEKKIDEILQQP